MLGNDSWDTVTNQFICVQDKKKIVMIALYCIFYLTTMAGIFIALTKFSLAYILYM